MNQEDFFAAKRIEEEGWEFLGTSDGGDMMFSRSIGGFIYVADVRMDR